MAATLVGMLAKVRVTPRESAIADLQDWFQEKVAKREDVREFATDKLGGSDGLRQVDEVRRSATRTP